MHAPTLPHPEGDVRADRTLRARARAWWLARHPRSDAWTLTQRNIYILPTRAGLAFGVTLLVMLLSSINYQLNLGYVLTFLLAGAGLVSMHQTHGTLRGLTLHLKPVAPGFAREPATVEVVLASPGAARHGVGLRFGDAGDGPHDTWVDVPAQGQAAARLTIVPPVRGWHEVPPLIVDTRFPLGLFRAWTVWRPAARLLAWPAPEHPAAPLPAGLGVGSQTRLSRPGAGSELDGVRPWRRGDTLRQLAWKKVARTGELVSRDTSTESSRELWLDWQDAAAAGAAEARLSRLAAWVLAADQIGQPFGLRLPGVHTAADRGDAHRRDLLRELALWQ